MFIKVIVVTALISTAQLSLSHSPSEDRLLTKKGAILCKSPLKLDEAVKAIGDEAWMDEIGCLLVKQGIPAVKISPESLPTREPLEVRLKPPGHPGATMWGQAWEFTFEDGEALPRW